MMDRLFIETKIASDDAGTISGIAWRYDTPDRVGDIIEKGAFSKATFPLPMLFSHDAKDPVGVWESASDEGDGYVLKGRLLVDDLPRAREVRALVHAGAVRGLSIGFSTKKSSPRRGGGRTIKELELVEASLVAVPMHPGARVTSAKSAVDALNIAAAINRATAHFTR